MMIRKQETDCSTRHTGSRRRQLPRLLGGVQSQHGQGHAAPHHAQVGCNLRATYTANITSPAGVRVTVKPQKVRLDARQRTRDYEIITFTPQGQGAMESTG